MEKYTIEKRACKFCKDKFQVFHANRFYCPEKYGKINFCSNRQKTKERKEKQLRRIADFLKRPSNGIVDSSYNANATISKVKNEEIIYEIIESMISNADKYAIENEVNFYVAFDILDIQELLNKGFNFKYYEEVKRISNFNYFKYRDIYICLLGDIYVECGLWFDLN